MLDSDQEQPAFPEPLNERRGDVSVFVRVEERAAVYMILQVHSAAGLSFKESCVRAAKALEDLPSDSDAKRTAMRLSAIQSLGSVFEKAAPDDFLFALFEKAGFSLQPVERALLSVTASEVETPSVRVNLFSALSSIMPKMPQL